MGQSEKFHSVGGNPFELTFANLPPADTRRWNTVRKVFVVRAIEVGMLSFDQASRRYSLSVEEFIGWRRLAANFDKHDTNSTVRKAIGTNLLWIGPDGDGSRAPPDTIFSESF
jgi:hypothetical protein